MSVEEPYIQQLSKYIKKNLSKGYTLDSLRFALENQDYSRSAIDRAVKLANEQLAKSAPLMKEKPNIKYQVIDDKEITKEQKLKFKKTFLDKFKELFR